MIYGQRVSSDSIELFRFEEALHYKGSITASLFFEVLKDSSHLFCYGLEPSEIHELINKAPIIAGSNDGYVIVPVSFNSGETVYFWVNKYLNEAPTITVFLSNGLWMYSLLDSTYTSNYHVSMLGVIHDPDGFTNMRENCGINYPVIQKIREGQLFIYWPTSEKTWWKVKTLDSCQIGYMHKSRIEPLDLSNKEVDNNFNCD